MGKTQFTKSTVSDNQQLFHFPSVQHAFNATSTVKNSQRLMEDPRLQMSKTLNNIIDSNINNLSNFKAGIFKLNKQAIQSIHAKIMASKEVSVE